MSAQQPPAPKPRNRSRLWMRALLIVSLSFNLLVLGLVAGAKWGGHRDHGFDTRGPNRGAIRDLGFAPFASALDREDRRHIGKALRDKSGSFADHRKILAVEFQGMLAALRAEPFDPDKLIALMGQQSERLSQRGQIARNMLVERITQMRDDERRALADRVEKSVRKRRK